MCGSPAPCDVEPELPHGLEDADHVDREGHLEPRGRRAGEARHRAVVAHLLVCLCTAHDSGTSGGSGARAPGVASSAAVTGTLWRREGREEGEGDTRTNESPHLVFGLHAARHGHDIRVAVVPQDLE